MDNLKKGFHYGAFGILVILAMGYLPSQIGMNFLCMAILACPVRTVRRCVDFALELCARRGMWILILLIFMGYYPLDQFGILADRLKNLIRMISGMIK